MTTYYEKILATELPEKEGNYATCKGDLYWYNNEFRKGWVNQYEGDRIEQISWWLLPMPSPIPSMTLEESKDSIAVEFGYKTWLETPNSARVLMWPSVAELYLQQNTLSLKQELEGLKEKLKQSEYNLLVVSETGEQLEQRANILTEALEGVMNLKPLIKYPDTTEFAHDGEAVAISQMYSKIETALSLTK